MTNDTPPRTPATPVTARGARPADSPYWDPALETQSREDWAAMKLELLKESLAHAYANAPYYRRSFDEAGVHPDDVTSLTDLARFPTIDKSVLRERQTAAPLLGDLAAVPEEEVVYVSASSGSTGVPTVSPFTAEDFEAWMDYEARQFWSSGLRPSDRYAHSLNFSLFIGGPCVLGAQKIGALSIHAGTVPSERLLSILETFQATAMWTTPSYAWYLGETALAKGIDPKTDLAIKKIFVAGEPGGSIPETRARIEALWGADVYDYYGLSDIFGACAGMCEEKDGLHWAEDHIHVEVIDPETGEPVAPGGRGEMVLTTLKKRARPLVRFRTGDIVSFNEDTCGCGRTSMRLMGVHGRLDDMLVIRGVNIFPSDVEAIVRQDHDFTGEYRLIVTRENHLDTLTVEAEKIHGFNGTDDELAARLKSGIKTKTGVGAAVTILPAETLPRETHKAKRVDDRRGQVWTA
ncbi:phenylacetate--CoA ligase family protein [Acuticoccus yangtzensis]|uniref:phenylacetate--CoA ligase family protein n=1 Tax=Acuticoccus yangtzensis TaxID=1443441 RepID=UPI0009F7E912|nr:phenylacetate--CoA ligase [Acuticoccus yangtzensis]ORE90800.1 phenylacetate--CoA ligase [Stappia sp. 22II-S9-Z10]